MGGRRKLERFLLLGLLFCAFCLVISSIKERGGGGPAVEPIESQRQDAETRDHTTCEPRALSSAQLPKRKTWTPMGSAPRISFLVVNEAGRPVKGAKVIQVSSGMRPGPGSWKVLATTGWDGKCAVPWTWREDETTLLVRATEYQVQKVSAERNRKKKVILQRGHKVTIQFQGQDENPLPGVRVASVDQLLSNYAAGRTPLLFRS